VISPDETAVPTVQRRLVDGRYDCVVVGAGVRLPPRQLVLFEAVITQSIAPRRRRPSPSTPAPRTPARRPRAGFDTRLGGL